MRLRVEGDLVLTAEDEVAVADYVRSFEEEGTSALVAQDDAWAQVAEDLLGPLGFAVDQIEPLP